ncbi:lipid-A-disaccharide synthase [Candidatus Finniella inopinata]|uniref:Lipid-A-disaccharide synthase n=1 Tax=Candidatus Finniella inopinata TaxID=1696036 RepID=A0A4Q7DKD8_9PROT|nr:lipid-A-disaccharide synthase [Candidatus Finniella inopinata]RZI45136.1 lipid-A-disaccharide synthase [Candidatus Finniella inopinata]
MTQKLIYLIAGEASGDFLGAQLMKALWKNDPNLRIKGVGGDYMTSQNFESLFPMQDLSLMGIAEILPHLPRLLKRIQETVNDIVAKKPDVLVTIDSPGFCHRVSREVKKKLPSIKIVHYVAPSVWAWRPGRAKKLGQWVDHLLTLFPFEPAYFLPHGLETTFVGHPLVEQDIRPDLTFRTRHNIPDTMPMVTLLAGSRKGEIEHLLPIFCQVAQNLPGVHVVTPTLPIFADQVGQALTKANLSHTVTTTPADKYAAFYASQAALAASGTVSLELALTGLPMVIGYKVSPVTYFLAKYLVNIKHVCLVNILLNKGLVPEYLQDACTVENLTTAMSVLLTDQSQQQKHDLKQAVNLLKSPEGIDPSQKAAEVILSLL